MLYISHLPATKHEARCSGGLSLYSLIAVYQLSETSGQATCGPEINSLEHVSTVISQRECLMLEKSNIEVAETTTDGSKRSIPQAFTVCSSKDKSSNSHTVSISSPSYRSGLHGESIEATVEYTHYTVSMFF
jgi:hypothetical protein